MEVNPDVIRIICQRSDFGAAAHVGGPVATEYKTFELSAPELVAWLQGNVGEYRSATVVGVEVPQKEAK